MNEVDLTWLALTLPVGSILIVPNVNRANSLIPNGERLSLCLDLFSKGAGCFNISIMLEELEDLDEAVR